MRGKNHKKNNLKLSQVRIIGGEYRRRWVKFIDADGLRPTPDRLRETLFNWLSPYLPNATVLDCCAGSGVLGFEALSRGAKHVTMIEPNRQQFFQLQANADTLAISHDKLTLYPTTAESILPTFTQTYDIIFLDPPYALNLWQPLLHLLQNLQHPDSLVYLEADCPIDDVTNLTKIKSTKMGKIYAGIYHSR